MLSICHLSITLCYVSKDVLRCRGNAVANAHREARLDPALKPPTQSPDLEGFIRRKVSGRASRNSSGAEGKGLWPQACGRCLPKVSLTKHSLVRCGSTTASGRRALGRRRTRRAPHPAQGPRQTRAGRSRPPRTRLRRRPPRAARMAARTPLAASGAPRPGPRCPPTCSEFGECAFGGGARAHRRRCWPRRRRARR